MHDVGDSLKKNHVRFPQAFNSLNVFFFKRKKVVRSID